MKYIILLGERMEPGTFSMTPIYILNFSLITPLALINEVNVGISKLESQTLAKPHVLTPIQQELMKWHHRLYLLLFPKIFRPVELGHLPRQLLDCKNNAHLCVSCQFGTSHCCPWQTKGKVSRSICTVYHK